MQTSAAELDPVLIRQELVDVLQSVSFRSSPQCQALLRYIVEQTLAGQEDMLRERVIGSVVFRRRPDYDTGSDPVVRSRVGEVRKRLAQYYLHVESAHGAIQIDVPTGSYLATFEPRKGSDREEIRKENRGTGEPTAEPVVVSELATPVGATGVESFDAHASRRWFWAIGLICAILISGMLLELIRSNKSSHEKAFDSFWAPVTHSTSAVLIYIGANYAYRLSNSFLDSYRLQHHLPNNGPEFFIDLHKGTSIDEGDLIPTNRYIGFGDVASTARIASLLTLSKKKYDLRYGSDIAITDLRSGPAILIGGFSNSWTLEVMHNLRYTLEDGDRIVDHQDKNNVWIRSSRPDGIQQDDYAIVSRLSKTETGNVIFAIAGIDTYSNQAAADFLSDPERIGKLLVSLPSGWEKKNLQIVLHAGIVKDVPVSANIVAVYSW